MKPLSVLVACLVVSTLVPAGAVGVANEPPLPEAGLDQTVTRGSQVLLDATGSRDPDGQLVAYDWSITSPTGRTVSPANESSPRTTFDATVRGQYEVTLTVTDDAGVERTDTLYVTVERGRGPRVKVDGANSTVAGDTESFTASLSRGAAPLDRIVWRVDGVRVASRSLAAEQSGDSLTQTLAATGSHTVSATVVDTDGLRDSATTRLTATPRQPTDQNPSSLADQYSPTVTGPDLVTGAEPLLASYGLSGISSSAAQTVEWHTERGHVGSKNTQTIQWAPGNHKLYAVVSYTDGSRDIARFTDETTAVTADPKPTVSLAGVSASGTITGDAVANDQYGNLQSVRVAVDDETVTRRPRIFGQRGGWPTKTKRVHFTKDIQSFNQSSVLRVVATDTRGQTAVVRKNLTPVSDPMIVDSGFVNHPVDSYHEQLNPERYAAKHVVTIALNGADPENVSVMQTPEKNNRTIQLTRSGYRKNRIVCNNELKIVSYWAGDTQGRYGLETRLVYNKIQAPRTDSLIVEPSPPEIRLKAITDGTTQQVDNWGLIIDASESFDPDGTDLKYIWGRGAHPITPDNTTGELRSIQYASLVVEDGSGATATQNHSYHQFYVPREADIKPVGDGPYLPNETVKFEVETNNYTFSKNRYDTRISARVTGVEGQVKKWERDTWKAVGKKAAKPRRWSGVIEIPASELVAKQGGAVEIYNDDNPNRISVSHQLPSVTVLQNATPLRRVTSVDDVRYLVAREKRIEKTVDTAQAKDRLVFQGYNVSDTRITDREYVLEERVKVRDARYETETKSFRRYGTLRLFLDERPEWNAGGARRETETWTTTETEWRNSRTGDGVFTGETRRKQVEDADYKRRYQYQYQHTVTETRTETEWVERTRTVEETRTRDVERCFGSWCHTYEEEYTVEVQEPYSVPVTEEYTYTTTETRTYWAFEPHRYSHDRTGESDLVKISPARYTTQYKYRFEETHKRTYTVYEATRKVQVEPPQYQWVRAKTVDGELEAYRQSRKSSYRIGPQSISREWRLTKSLGETKVISDTYHDEENVLETRATVRGVVLERRFNPDTGTFATNGTREFNEKYHQSGLRDEGEIRRSYEESVRCAAENTLRRWRCHE